MMDFTLVPKLELGNQRKSTVIPAWMPESSHKDVKLWAYTFAQSSTCAAAKLPSMALDSGIHAGMTGFGTLVYNDEGWSLGTSVRFLKQHTSTI